MPELILEVQELEELAVPAFIPIGGDDGGCDHSDGASPHGIYDGYLTDSDGKTEHVTFSY